MLAYRGLTERIIGLAIEGHRNIGLELLEAVYGECLCLEFEEAGSPFQRQVMMLVVYKRATIPARVQRGNPGRGCCYSQD
jgi:GxxExxY protein